MKSNILVKIEPRHFAASGGWSHQHKKRCPLYNALKEMFPRMEMEVGASRVFMDPDQGIYNKTFTITNWGTMNKDGDHLGLGGETDWSVDKINELAYQSKQSLEGIPTVSVLLKVKDN